MAESERRHSLIATPPTRAVAGTLGLAGFSIAVLAGLSAGNEATEIVMRALVSMAGCLLVGAVAGRFCATAVNESIDAFARRRPVPDSDIEVDAFARRIHEERQRDRAKPDSAVDSGAGKKFKNPSPKAD